MENCTEWNSMERILLICSFYKKYELYKAVLLFRSLIKKNSELSYGPDEL